MPLLDKLVSSPKNVFVFDEKSSTEVIGSVSNNVSTWLLLAIFFTSPAEDLIPLEFTVTAVPTKVPDKVPTDAVVVWELLLPIIWLFKLLNESTANIKNCSINNVFQYINKFLNNALLKNNINKQIIKSRNINKKCNMYWLNKVIILYDYVNSMNKLVDINVPKGNNGILQILNNNQFMII